MHRSILLAASLLVVLGCQAPAPVPSPPAVVRPSPPSPTIEPRPTAVPTPRPTSPFTGDTFGDAVLYGTADAFVEALMTLYREPRPDLLDATFTAGGLEAATRFDWRLRGSLRGETRHVGTLSVRGGIFGVESPEAVPPSFDVDLSIAVEPGAELIDARTRRMLQTWNERQLFNMHVVFEYDLDSKRWQAASVVPAEPGFGQPPPTLAPPVRCKGLGGDRSDESVRGPSRPWCQGGREGTLATTDVVRVLSAYPCGRSRASIVTFGWPIGSPIDDWAHYHYVRDPDDFFKKSGRLRTPYLADTRMPKDAYSTGLTDGEFEIWVSPETGPEAVWARRTTKVERWPRVADPWLVIDCN